MPPSSPARNIAHSHKRSPSDPSASDADDDHHDAPVDLMVVSRARRSNAGNRMSTLLAQSAQEPDDEWGEEWEDAPNEEEFVGDDANNQEDYNVDSSSDEDEDEGADDDAGEKELRKAERQERIKKRKPATNPFTARLAAASRKRVKLDVPSAESPDSVPRPKKKSERASWIPLDEDGPTRTSSRRQTVANKQSTLAKLKEKDRRRDDTLAMMKAAEARKAKDEPKPLTQAERLAEAARVEKLNSKSLHRWEEEEELRAAERQAKIDALKNRQIEGPFIRYYSGPGIWVDDKVKYTGKDAPSLEDLEEKLNKDSATPTPTAPDQPPNAEEPSTADSISVTPNGINQDKTSQPQVDQSLNNDSHPPPPESGALEQGLSTESQSQPPSMPFPNTMMGAPPGTVNPFLFGMEQYAHPEQPQQPEYGPLNFAPDTSSELPPNPFLFTSPFSQAQSSFNDPLLTQDGTIPPSHLLAQFQQPSQPSAPPPPPQPPKRKVISRALRNLLILSSFPNLEATAPISGRVKAAASVLKEKDRASLIQLSVSLFNWSLPDATAFVTAMLSPPKATTKKEREALNKPRKELCAVSNKDARYRDPETGIAYHDSRAFGVLRGVVGGGFVWCGEAGCYVGGRAKPMVGMGKGFLGMAPARGVPKRFLEMQREVVGAAKKNTEGAAAVPAAGGGSSGDGVGGKGGDVVVVSEGVTTGNGNGKTPAVAPAGQPAVKPENPVVGAV
ncbi:unnamed protein product [Periconia digitata]|uniref:Vps72/YL1 C-terminal domain-containing protein n=1 Tax=Periconia digitata TaxID=1303443 RepID=A0A9W4XR58_9PLEO|nr:unnamed protein product [Periconia digitata]